MKMNNLILLLSLILCSCYNAQIITISNIGEEDKPIYPVIISSKELSNDKLISLSSENSREVFLLRHTPNTPLKLKTKEYKKIKNFIFKYRFLESSYSNIAFGTLKISFIHNKTSRKDFYINSRHSVDFLNELILNSRSNYVFEDLEKMKESLDIPDYRKPSYAFDMQNQHRSD